MKKISKIIINNVCGSDLIPQNIRVKVYRLFGLNIITDAVFPKNFFEGNHVKIGKGSWINRECYFDCENARITIGENCGVGMQVLFCTSTHIIGDEIKRASQNIQRPIEIGDGCWIGARSIILPGVKIGHGSIIAAGSVVTDYCESNSLYAGVPAKKIKNLYINTP